jgi:hypothetical protein
MMLGRLWRGLRLCCRVLGRWRRRRRWRSRCMLGRWRWRRRRRRRRAMLMRRLRLVAPWALPVVGLTTRLFRRANASLQFHLRYGLAETVGDTGGRCLRISDTLQEPEEQYSHSWSSFLQLASTHSPTVCMNSGEAQMQWLSTDGHCVTSMALATQLPWELDISKGDSPNDCYYVQRSHSEEQRPRTLPKQRQRA